MPTVHRTGPYRLFFYSGDRGEPPHVHVVRESMTAKFWLTPVRLHGSTGFTRLELRKLQTLVEDNRQSLLESWNEYFTH